MYHLSRFNPKVSYILCGVVALLLVLGVACGGSATETAVPAATSAPEPTSESVAGTTSAPDSTAVPTAQPTAADAPVGTVHSATLGWLVGSFHNERFDYVFGGGHDYARQVHGFLISSDVDETGTRRIETPGIASAWEISSDGLSWTFTIRQGLKFHDGSDLTTEDVFWTLQHIMGPQAVEYGGGGVVNLAKKTDRIEQTQPIRSPCSTMLSQLKSPNVSAKRVEVGTARSSPSGIPFTMTRMKRLMIATPSALAP